MARLTGIGLVFGRFRGGEDTRSPETEATESGREAIADPAEGVEGSAGTPLATLGGALGPLSSLPADCSRAAFLAFLTLGCCVADEVPRPADTDEVPPGAFGRILDFLRLADEVPGPAETDEASRSA